MSGGKHGTLLSREFSRGRAAGRDNGRNEFFPLRQDGRGIFHSQVNNGYRNTGTAFTDKTFLFRKYAEIADMRKSRDRRRTHHLMNPSVFGRRSIEGKDVKFFRSAPWGKSLEREIIVRKITGPGMEVFRFKITVPCQYTPRPLLYCRPGTSGPGRLGTRLKYKFIHWR